MYETYECFEGVIWLFLSILFGIAVVFLFFKLERKRQLFRQKTSEELKKFINKYINDFTMEKCVLISLADGQKHKLLLKEYIFKNDYLEFDSYRIPRNAIISEEYSTIGFLELDGIGIFEITGDKEGVTESGRLFEKNDRLKGISIVLSFSDNKVDNVDINCYTIFSEWKEYKLCNRLKKLIEENEKGNKN